MQSPEVGMTALMVLAHSGELDEIAYISLSLGTSMHETIPDAAGRPAIDYLNAAPFAAGSVVRCERTLTWMTLGYSRCEALEQRRLKPSCRPSSTVAGKLRRAIYGAFKETSRVPATFCRELPLPMFEEWGWWSATSGRLGTSIAHFFR